MFVGNLCRNDVVSVDAAEGLVQAARLMRERHVGMLVVVASSAASVDLRVVGVLTDRDIVTAVIAKDANPHDMTVGDVMTRNPLLAGETSSIPATLRHMSEVGVRRVPVVGAREQLVGILSVDDVLDKLSGVLGDVAGAIRNEQRAERSLRP